MDTHKYNLIVVAHPDDESIFFSGLIQSVTNLPWKVVCVTDGNADGQGEQRAEDFTKACRDLAVTENEQWDFPDIFEKRLDVSELVKRLKQLETPVNIYTHSIVGEDGHPHHEDVCFAVHQAFHNHDSIWSLAYNCWAEQIINLTKEQFELKQTLLMNNYYSELVRFINLVPATYTEGFSKISYVEIEELYFVLTQKKKIETDKLDKYLWIKDHVEKFLSQDRSRLF